MASIDPESNTHASSASSEGHDRAPVPPATTGNDDPKDTADIDIKYARRKDGAFENAGSNRSFSFDGSWGIRVMDRQLFEPLHAGSGEFSIALWVYAPSPKVPYIEQYYACVDKEKVSSSKRVKADDAAARQLLTHLRNCTTSTPSLNIRFLTLWDSSSGSSLQWDTVTDDLILVFGGNNSMITAKNVMKLGQWTFVEVRCATERKPTFLAPLSTQPSAIREAFKTKCARDLTLQDLRTLKSQALWLDNKSLLGSNDSQRQRSSCNRSNLLDPFTNKDGSPFSVVSSNGFVAGEVFTHLGGNTVYLSPLKYQPDAIRASFSDKRVKDLTKANRETLAKHAYWCLPSKDLKSSIDVRTPSDGVTVYTNDRIFSVAPDDGRDEAVKSFLALKLTTSLNVNGEQQASVQGSLKCDSDDHLTVGMSTKNAQPFVGSIILSYFGEPVSNADEQKATVDSEVQVRSRAVASSDRLSKAVFNVEKCTPREELFPMHLSRFG
eukprot:gb/GECG01011924.1/.p1 GENE.gb/GECG01011924.1/~~gb/GECG01011924.1/.p1  ORF type:complete len:494 (+),score=55.09 gb/GECG01011924.1/:1-1482(+)